jgi:2,3-bisphosphoglycerate-dependent phosphoglycerate mutase
MLWLVRHGESEANAGGITSDCTGIELTLCGRAKAEAVAAACPERPAWVGLSPYLRARQTAEPLLARYADVPIEELPVQEFTYLAAARCIGMNGLTRRPLSGGCRGT